MSLDEAYQPKQITADQCKLLVKVLENMPSMPNQWWDDIGRVLGTSGKAARERLRYLRLTLSPKLSCDEPAAMSRRRRPTPSRTRANSQAMRPTTSGRRQSAPIAVAPSHSNSSPVRLRQRGNSLQNVHQRELSIYTLPTSFEDHEEPAPNNEDRSQQAAEPFPTLPVLPASSHYGFTFDLPYTSRMVPRQPHHEQNNTQLSPELFIGPSTDFTLTQEPTESLHDVFNNCYGQNDPFRTS